MPEWLIGLLFVFAGCWGLFRRKQAARDNEAFQRYLRPKMKPYDTTTIKGTEMLFAGVGALFIVAGALVLFGALSFER